VVIGQGDGVKRWNDHANIHQPGDLAGRRESVVIAGMPQRARASTAGAVDIAPAARHDQELRR
jgi:hypothetical protein